MHIKSTRDLDAERRHTISLRHKGKHASADLSNPNITRSNGSRPRSQRSKKTKAARQLGSISRMNRTISSDEAGTVKSQCGKFRHIRPSRLTLLLAARLILRNKPRENPLKGLRVGKTCGRSLFGHFQETLVPQLFLELSGGWCPRSARTHLQQLGRWGSSETRRNPPFSGRRSRKCSATSRCDCA